MKVVLSPKAEKQLTKLAKLDQIAIANKIRILHDANIIRNAGKLKSYKDVYQVGVGDYRIVYKKSSTFLYIILIGHRREIYQLVSQLLR